MTDPIVAVDLFCGGGGLSTALAQACEELDREVELVAVNHWGKAIETHERNHPWATHLNAKIEELHPPDVVEPGSVDILIAAPECTHFSTARGGKPVTEQARASPMHVLDWVGKLQPQTVLLENVPEFQSWGPIVDGEPTRDGTKFDAWKAQLEADRYSVRHTKLNAADYGDATSRRRFFVMARRDYRPSFPERTHSDEADDLPDYRPAADIIDWSDTGTSIWTRSRPLSNNTMQRIAEGIRQHCHDELEPYADTVAAITPADIEAMQDDIVAVDALEQAVDERDDPFLVAGPALDGGDGTAMVMGQHSNARALDADDSPVPTIATRGAIHKIQVDPFVLPRNGSRGGLHSNATYEPGDRPLHTVTAKNHDGHLVSPFLVEYNGNSDERNIEEPLPTVTTTDRHALIVPDLFPWGLDLRYRMLQPRELAAAQGFPEDYEFAGNKTETTKQIGNAVPVNLGKALVKQLLVPSDQPAISQWEGDRPAIADGGAR
ncbi:DNA cytosine methyltransferase [Haloarcula argentinensis]|uniref:DNA (cytosine-5-)-methyltransferase n=1 Tax=Haloarcula argentinensis TaxID=43776 RepID=A0A847UQE9_HALAR|nr:DNA cytosine methyltransferase [Haloarcula argentinensis]NLV14334.1 cytosine methyltransferase [Haloarcula argentinensis]